MDGNRRWAKKNGLPPIAGHTKVADDILEPLVEHAAKRGVSYVTFWAFSTENWKRNPGEVSGILSLFRHVVGKRWARLHEKGVRIKVIGDTTKFPADLQQSLASVVEQTKHNSRITAVFALNYGGRDELVRAVRSLGGKTDITEDDISYALDTKGIPDPDLIIRTSGEQRLSGFLPWQGVYSELYFPSFPMPEFTTERLDEAIEEFDARNRRFGK